METPWEKGNVLGLEAGGAWQDGEAMLILEADEEGGRRSGGKCSGTEGTARGGGPHHLCGEPKAPERWAHGAAGTGGGGSRGHTTLQVHRLGPELLGHY